MENLGSLEAAMQADIAKAHDLKSLDDIKIKYFGKKGTITALLKNIGQVAPELRKDYGQSLNQLKAKMENAWEEKKQILSTEAKLQGSTEEQIDISLPGRAPLKGSIHPITSTLNRLVDIFTQLGFDVATGPEIENDYYNFEALNIPANHPARAMHDTFYLEEGFLLRTHTSPVQVRAMEKTKPPIRLIAPGSVYRCDYDVTHSPMFHQIEGLVIDENTHFGHLKGMLHTFLSSFFNSDDIKIRLRPSFFPFTEPSAEVDMSCVICKAKGCRVCKNTGWLEVLGCGMVHPKVLQNAGYNPDEVQGYAFGLGVERLGMLYHQIDDLRLLYENDLRFLQQFA